MAATRSFRRTLEGVFGPKAATVSTHAAEHGGAAARAERQALAHDLKPDTPPKGAGVDPHAPKDRAPTTVHHIDPAKVTTDATAPPKRPPLDLNPAIKPLAWGVGGGLAALGLGKMATNIGDAWYHAGEEQLPYTQTLPDGKSVFVMDPVTGETYLLVVKDGGGVDIHDPNGPEGGGSGGYGVVPVSDGDRAEAEATKDVFSGLFNPWVILGLIALLAVVLILASRKGGSGAKASGKGGSA